MHTLEASRSHSHVGHAGHSKHKHDVKKGEAKKTEENDGVAAKKKDAEAQIIKLKEAKGKDKVDWSDEVGQKEKAGNVPNLAAMFG